MRISSIFKTDKISKSPNMQVVSLIKESIKQSNEELFRDMYLYKNHKKGKKSKDFCCSIYLKGYQMHDEYIEIKDGGRVIINFSSPDLEFIEDLYNGMIEKKIFNYKQFSLEKEKIIMVKEKKIEENIVTFRTLSPIAIKSKEGRFIDIDDINYQGEMNYIINQTLENYRGYGLKQPIKFIPINMKKVVVKEDIEDFKKITDKKVFYVNSYKGEFKLVGDVEDLNLIYKLGIGFRRNQLFGMVEVIG